DRSKRAQPEYLGSKQRAKVDGVLLLLLKQQVDRAQKAGLCGTGDLGTRGGLVEQAGRDDATTAGLRGLLFALLGLLVFPSAAACCELESAILRAQPLQPA